MAVVIAFAKPYTSVHERHRLTHLLVTARFVPLCSCINSSASRVCRWPFFLCFPDCSLVRLPACSLVRLRLWTSHNHSITLGLITSCLSLSLSLSLFACVCVRCMYASLSVSRCSSLYLSLSLLLTQTVHTKATASTQP